MANETFSFEEAVGPETFSFEDAIGGQSSDDSGQFVKGAKTGVTGLKSMWESAGVLKDAGAAKSSQSALKLFDDIEFGRVAKPEQIDTRTPQQKQRGDMPDFATQQARQYMGATPDVREAMRAQLSGDLANRKELVAASMETLRRYQEDSQKTKGRITDLTDVAGVKDFTDWASFNMGQGSATLVPLILAAVATGGTGAAALGYGMAVSDLNKDRIDGVMKSKDATANDVIKRVQDTSGSTFGAAIPYAALDVAAGPVRGIVSNAAKNQLKKQTLKQVAMEVPGDLLEEGLAEGAQEAIKIGTSVGLGEEDKFLTAENAKRIFNAGAAGAAGAPLGTGIKAAQTYAKPDPKPDPVESVMATSSIDEAIQAATDSIATLDQPIAKASDGDLLARLIQVQPEQARQTEPVLPIERPAPVGPPVELPPIAWPEQTESSEPTAMQLAMQRAQEKADVSTTDGVQPVLGGRGSDDGAIPAGRLEAGAADGERRGSDGTRPADGGVFEPSQQPALDAAGPLNFSFTKNASGTVLVDGDPAAIRAAFPDAQGMVKYTDGQPSGVLFSTRSSPSVLAQLETPRVQNPAQRTNPETTQAAPAQAPAAARPDAGGQPAARATAGAGALAADGLKPVDQRLAPISKRATAPTMSLAKDSSWVIKNKQTGEVVMETFDNKKVDALNTAKYEAVPIQEHLGGLSRKFKDADATPADPRLIPVSKRGTPDKQKAIAAERVKMEAMRVPRSTETSSQATPELAQPAQGKEVSRYIGKFGKGMGKDAARLEAQRLNRTNDGIVYTAEEHNDPKLENPYAVVGRKGFAQPATKQKQSVAPVKSEQQATEKVADEAKNSAPVPVNPVERGSNPSETTPAKDAPQFSREATNPAARATEILDAAGISGQERISALKDVKAGTITPEELQAAYPAKEPAKTDDKRPTANVAPVSRSPSETPMYEAMRQLSRFEESFQTGRSDSTDLADIAKEMTSKNPDLGDFTVEKSTALHQGNRKPTLALKVTLPNGNEVKLLDIFDTDKAKPFVVIGNSEAGQGVGGATAYQIAFAWAHNNGKTMRPDPAGLTVINRLRRTEAMISSAMQFGTTKHLEPHQDQYVALLERMRDGGKEPEDTHYSSRPDIHGELEALKEKLWTSGDSATNIATNVQHLLEASTQLAYAREPATRNFEVSDGVLRVRDGREGTLSLANDALAESSDATKILGVVLRPAVSGVGASTLRRAAVSGSVARAVQRNGQGDAVSENNGNQSPDVAALQAIRSVLGKLDLSTPEVGRDVFYSRGDGPARGITQDQFNAELSKAFGSKVAEKLQAKGVVVPLADQTKLPSHVVPFLRDGDIVFGFYDHKTNKTYAVLKNLTPDMVKGLVLHEVGVHYGFENMLGAAKYANIVKRLDLMRRAGNRAVKAAYAEAVANSVNDSQVSEEMIAYLVQNHPENGVVAEIIAKIKAFLFNEFGIGGKYLTPADIQMLARAAVDHASRTEDGGSMVPAFMREANKIWRSALSDGVAELTYKQLPANAWTDALKSLVNKGKVKADEIEWSGVNDWLKMQNGKVSKEQVQEYLDQNGVKVEETTLGGLTEESKRDMAFHDQNVRFAQDKVDAAIDEALDYAEKAGANQVQLANASMALRAGQERGNEESLHKAYKLVEKGAPADYDMNKVNDAQDELASAKDHQSMASQRVEKNTKFGQYVVPGGENYREVLLMLPDPPGIDNRLKEISEEIGRRETSAARVFELRDERESLEEELGKVKLYRSSHWDQPNVLAHVRLDDRTDADGKKVLFVQELQSDWGQQAKKDGIKGAIPTDDQVREHFGLKEGVDPADYRQEMIDTNRKGVPNAPYIDKTDKWLNLALKRVIKLAIDGGYDKVAFANGEQSAAHYDLEKHVKSIEYIDGDKAMSRDNVPEGSYRIHAVNHDGRKAFDKIVARDDLPDVVGKEIAQKIINGEGSKDDAVLSGMKAITGLDLKAGGEGMKTFYDKIVPIAAGKLVAKLGGGKFEMVSISDGKKPGDRGPGGVVLGPNTKSKSLDQPGFAITDTMRDSAAGGMPMFSRTTVAPSTGLPDETRMQKVQRVMQDKYNRVKLIQDLLREDGGTVGEQQDVYKAEERMHGRVHEVLRDFADDVIHPLIKKATDFKVDLNELAAYAYAKHAAERNAQIQTINKNVRTGSGMSDADAQAAIDAVKATGKFAQFEELHKDLMAITSTTRRLMLDEGLISQEQYDALENQYENYVPLRGFEDVEPDSGNVRPGLGRGFNTKGKETIAAMGRDSKAGDIIENIIRDYERATIRAERNTVGKTFLDLVTSNPDPKLWEVQPMTRATRKVNGLVEYVDTPDKGDDTISVKVGGEQVYIKINDPLLLRAMANTFKAETSDAERFLSKTLGLYTSLLRNTITRYNPAFGVINAVRDVQMGAMGVYDELGAEGVRRYAANYGPAVASSGRSEFGKNDPQRNDMDKWMREMRFAGGTTGGVFMRDHDTIKKELRDTMLQAGVKPNGVIEGVRASGAWKAAGKLLHGLELIGSMSENSARLAAYATAREMGKTPAQAASIAKNLTVNFNRFGEQGQLINTAFLFYNASVQGSVRIAQMAKNPKVRQAFAGMAAAGMGLALMGAAVGGDDEDGQAYWDKIPDFEKERNLIIMLPPGTDMGDKVGTHGRYIKIPMAYGLNVFPVLGYQLADLARNVKDPAQGVGPTKAAINMVSATAGSYNPAGGSFDPRDKVQLAMAVSPTVVDAGIQLGAGVDSFGKPTGPQKSPYDKDPDSETVSSQNHGNINHRIARWLNETTGGNRARAGAIDIEPGTIKNVQGILAGGLGKFVGDVVNLGYLGATDAPIKDRDIPIWKAFYGEYNESSGMSQYYERSRKAMEELDDMTSERKLGIKRDYSAEEKFLQGMGAYAKNISQAMGNLKREEVRIAESNTTTKEKELKRRMIQKRREKMAEDFNTRWYGKESELKRAKD